MHAEQRSEAITQGIVHPFSAHGVAPGPDGEIPMRLIHREYRGASLGAETVVSGILLVGTMSFVAMLFVTCFDLGLVA